MLANNIYFNKKLINEEKHMLILNVCLPLNLITKPTRITAKSATSINNNIY